MNRRRTRALGCGAVLVLILAGCGGGAFVLGEIAAGHIPRGWHTTMRRRTPAQRRLGIALCALALALVSSGYALMYLVPEPARAAWGWAHSGVGVLMAGVLIVHGSGMLHRRAA